MGAAADDAAVLEVHDLVGQRDRRLAVGHHDERGGRVVPVLVPVVAQRGEDARLDLRVDRGGGVVEDQQPRTAYEGAGEREPLALATGERGAALAQLGVDAVGQGGDEAVGLGGAQRGPHVGVGDVGAERDVAPDGVVEHEGRLGHERHVAGQRALAEALEVVPVDADPARVGVDQPGHQAGQRALAGGRGADQRDGAPRADVEVDAAQQRRVGVVGVVEVLDLEQGARRERRQLVARRRACCRSRRAPPWRGGSPRPSAGTRRAASRSPGSGRRRWSGGRRRSPRRRRSVAPLETRATPTARTTRTPRLGRLARVGSNTARIRPARTLTSRSSWALARNRSVSSTSRPSVLTTIAPSKDSWAISLTSARRPWARVISGEE